jgi:hypothetical protein
VDDIDYCWTDYPPNFSLIEVFKKILILVQRMRDKG